MDENRCRDCKWLATDGKRYPKGFECKNPEKQEIWKKRRESWMGEFRQPYARYKMPAATACKKFEPREQDVPSD